MIVTMTSYVTIEWCGTQNQSAVILFNENFRSYSFLKIRIKKEDFDDKGSKYNEHSTIHTYY